MSDQNSQWHPYEPPSASLEAAPKPVRSVGWKIYLWAIVSLIVLAYASFGPAWMQPLDYIDFAISTVGLVGLFGYAYSRQIFSEEFWRIWLPIEVIWDLTYILVVTRMGLGNQIDDAPTNTLEDLLWMLIVLPLYVALFRYGHRSAALWRAT